MRRVLAWLERALARRTGEADVYPFWLRSGKPVLQSGQPEGHRGQQSRAQPYRRWSQQTRPAGNAQASAPTQILTERHTNDRHAASDPRNFSASLRQQRGWNMFEHLCAQHRIEILVGEF